MFINHITYCTYVELKRVAHYTSNFVEIVYKPIAELLFRIIITNIYNIMRLAAVYPGISSPQRYTYMTHYTLYRYIHNILYIPVYIDNRMVLLWSRDF